MSKTVNGKGIDILEEEGIISPEEHDKMIMDNLPKGVKAINILDPEGIENLMSTVKERAMSHFKMGLATCRNNVETLSEMVDRDEVVNVLTNILDVAEKGAKTEGAPELRICMTLLAFVDSFMNNPIDTLEGVMDVLNELQEK